jgi:hypothetical protein
MIRTAALLVLVAASGAAADPSITAREIATPAASAGASGSALKRAPAGVTWLTWIESEGKTTALRFATFEAANQRWSAASTIARGADWRVSPADFPALTVGPQGRATAVWLVNHPATSAGHDDHGSGTRAVFSQTSDAGQTWSPPAPLTRESDSVEFVSLATLADGRVLAAWLDGRAKRNGVGAQQLFARIVGGPEPDRRVDDSVCDCCHTTLTAFPDGTALLAYRGRTGDEVRDIRVTRFRSRGWDEPRPLNSDDWRINGCPVNGPQLASDGGRVAAAWFTAADNDPRVLATLSSDAGARFLMPLRLSETKPAGRVATVLLHDGAFLVTWVDTAGSLWLRRITPDFAAAEPMQLTAAEQGGVKGFPRAALVRDYAGGRTPAQFLITYTREGRPALRTLLVDVPEGDLLEAEKNCECAPTPEQLQGFSIRGVIVGVKAEAATMQVRHFEVPGIFAAGTREFKVSPEIIGGAVQPGRQFLGRVEKHNGAWYLYDVRLIAGPPK